MDKNYDIIIIGAGPAGYHGALRAAASGLSTALVEADAVGGVCLNAGCIPTKALLNSAKLYAGLSEAERFGVVVGDSRFDLAAAMDWKNTVVRNLVKGIEASEKKLGVDIVRGGGRIVDRNTVVVTGKDGEQSQLQGKSILIATGSKPARPPIPGVDGPNVVTSRELLSRTELPDRVAIIGGGYIGMEFATFLSSVGVSVSVIEMLPEIIPTIPAKTAAAVRKNLSDVSFFLGCRVTAIDAEGVRFAEPDGEERRVDADLVLLSIGRRPVLDGVGLEAIGVETDRKGIVVDDRQRTNVPGVYAAGDCTGRSMLAHSAYRMAEVAVHDILGRPDRMRYDAVPWVVFTRPEVAGCGMTEAEAKAAGLDVEVHEISMKMSGRYMAEHPRERGIISAVVERSTKRIVGAEALGSGAGELIFAVAIAIEMELRPQDIRETIFPHPTVSEVFRDLMWEFDA